MIPSVSICQRSSLYLNEHATQLSGAPASFFVHYWGAKPQHSGNRPHQHSFMELCYAVDGTGTFYHDGVAYPIRRGAFYCTKPGNRHHIESGPGLLLLFVAFEVDRESSHEDFVRLFDMLAGKDHLFIADAADAPAVLMWQALLRYCGGGAAPYAQVAQQLACSLLTAATAMFVERGGHVDAGESPGEEQAFTGALKTAKHFVTDHLAGKLTLKDVSRAVHLSERQLSRLLAEQLGMTFPAWLRNERVKRAAYLLAYTDLKLEQIALQTGFDSVHYFSRVFSALMRVPPARFRKSVHAGGQDAELVKRYLHAAANRSDMD